MGPKYYIKAWERIEKIFFYIHIIYRPDNGKETLLAQCFVSIPPGNVIKLNAKGFQRFSDLFRRHEN